MLLEEGGEDVGPRDRLDDLIDHGGGELGEADAEGEGRGLGEVGLVGGVLRGEGIDAPGADSESVEACEGAFVVAGYEADFYGIAEEGLKGRGVSCGGGSGLVGGTHGDGDGER